jgi:hypothetical protein
MFFSQTPSRRAFPVLFVLMISLLACGEAPEAGVEGMATEGEAEDQSRIIAIGDIHGDLEAAKAALRLGGAIDAEDKWIGGALTVVQTGDILDRGDDEARIMDLFRRLRTEAEAVGGAVHVLNGNHELMNAYLDFRYVTEGGFQSFESLAEIDPADSVLASLEPEQRARAAAFRPGGPLALQIAEQRVEVILDGTIFTHAGILPVHVDMGLDNMEASVHSWLLGDTTQPHWIRGDSSPVWNRVYSGEPTAESCDTLGMVLERLGLERMVVGHTVQDAGITSYCGGRLWCIDVGLAAHYGGRPEVLEIKGNTVRSLR